MEVNSIAPNCKPFCSEEFHLYTTHRKDMHLGRVFIEEGTSTSVYSVPNRRGLTSERL